MENKKNSTDLFTTILKALFLLVILLFTSFPLFTCGIHHSVTPDKDGSVITQPEQVQVREKAL
ncbi:MAG: hypothetical protein GY754_18240 [bacterium]|nr:hypothetical protein [bacterium]